MSKLTITYEYKGHKQTYDIHSTEDTQLKDFKGGVPDTFRSFVMETTGGYPPVPEGNWCNCCRIFIGDNTGECDSCRKA